MQSLLSIILLFPALGGLVLLCVPNSQTRLIRILGLTISFITFVLSLLLWVLDLFLPAKRSPWPL